MESEVKVERDRQGDIANQGKRVLKNNNDSAKINSSTPHTKY